MVQCDACGADIDVGSQFCGECGAVVGALGRELAAETRGGAAKARSVQPSKANKGKDGRGKLHKTTEPGLEAGELRSTIRGLAQSAPSPAVSPAPKSAPEKATLVSPAAKASDGKSASKPVAAGAPPPVATPVRSNPPPFGDQSRGEFQRLLDEVETGFDAILVKGDSEAPPPRTAGGDDDDATITAENAFDQSQARQLFHDLVIANAQSIRDFMIEVRLGASHSVDRTLFARRAGHLEICRRDGLCRARREGEGLHPRVRLRRPARW